MATINAPSLGNTEYSGEAPAAHAHGYNTFAGEAAGTVVRLNKLFAGTKVYDAKMINAALGAATTVKLGFEYVNGESGGDDDYFVAATATDTAKRTDSAAKPITLAHDAYIIATTAGGAATGALDTVLDFEHRGK